jgi:hypothetical protein
LTVGHCQPNFDAWRRKPCVYFAYAAHC